MRHTLEVFAQLRKISPRGGTRCLPASIELAQTVAERLSQLSGMQSKLRVVLRQDSGDTKDLIEDAVNDVLMFIEKNAT